MNSSSVSCSIPVLFEPPCCILAPMVRIGHLGFREMCLQHGAGVVFSEEVVAAKLTQCHREVTHYPEVASPVVEFVCYEAWKNSWKRTVVFNTLRAAATVLQLGVADPEIALAATLLVAADVDGIDVNMGCPKKFSVSNGFGAALMRKTQLAGQILSAVHEGMNRVRCKGNTPSKFHLSFKCRLLASPSETYTMLRDILLAASHSPSKPVIHAITIHARYIEQRSETPARYAEAKEVVERCRADSLFQSIRFALNGSLTSRDDALKKCVLYGFDAGMLARSALQDPTVFEAAQGNTTLTLLRGLDLTEKITTWEPQTSTSVLSHFITVLKEMWHYSVAFRTPFKNFKYQLQRLIPEVSVLKPLMPRIQSETHRYEDFLPILGVTDRNDPLYVLCSTCSFEVELLDERPTSNDSIKIEDGSEEVIEGARKRQKKE